MTDNPFDNREICLIGISDLGLYFTEEEPAGGGRISVVLTTSQRRT